jgi:FkbM family methyltransferase
MELDPIEWTQTDIIKAGKVEPVTSDFIRRTLNFGDTFVDIGAHVGFHSLVAAKTVSQGGKVFAFEPQPYNCNKILINARHNGLTNIRVVAAAAGSTDGWVTLSDQPPTDKARLTLLDEGPDDQGQRFDVPIIRLDTYARNGGFGPVRMLKIDVEGYELEVLHGARETLRNVDYIVYESLPECDLSTRKEVSGFLHSCGFQLTDLLGNSWDPELAAIENNVLATRVPRA